MLIVVAPWRYTVYNPRPIHSSHALLHLALTFQANDVTDVLGSFTTFSMREPHKLFQNSFSIFQKRRDFAEPVFTKYP